jgi:hypothetical protein
MKQSNIEWFKYNKIFSASDAFIYLEDLVAYLHYQSGTDLSAAELPANFYTAGTTDNPEDYSLPEVKNLNKLSRINSFNKNSSSSIHSYLEGLDSDSLYPQQIKVENIDYIEDELINSDSKIFLEQLKKLQKTKYNDFDKILELFKTSDKVLKSSYFDLGSRFYSNFLQTQEISDETIPETTKTVNETKTEEKIEEVNVEEINVERYEFQNENISIDINNFDEKTVVDNREYSSTSIDNESNFKIDYNTNNTTEDNVTTIIKDESQTYTNIENKINQEIINLESKIFNSTLTKVEFNEIKYQIFNQLDNLIETKTTNAIEEFKEKNKVEVERMFDKFLRS